MSDNPFDNALDAADDPTVTEDTETEDAMASHYEALTTGIKTETVGIAVSEEMHRFYQELQHADEVEIDVSQSVRDHIEKLAHRHDQVFERSMRKLEIEREY